MVKKHADKRSVATDALETLGTIIDDTQKRDAIHLAVEPVTAGEKLYPGQKIYLINKYAYAAKPTQTHVGIVDPFLDEPVFPEQKFWLIVPPRQITSLRHVWTHPSFPEEVVSPTLSEQEQNKKDSEKWIRDFVSRSDCPDYDTLMAAVRLYSPDYDDYLHFSGRDAHGEIPDEFWYHAGVVLGRTFNISESPKYFSCSC